MRYERAHEITWDDAAERVVILDAEGSAIITLNPVGSLLWKRLDAPRSAEDLAEHLRGLFPDVPREQLASDVGEFIDHLVDENLLRASA